MLIRRYTTSMEFRMDRTFETTKEELITGYNMSEKNFNKLIETGKCEEPRYGGNGFYIITILLEK